MADATAAIHQPDRLHPRHLTLGVAASTTLYPGIGISLNADGYAQQMGDDASTLFIGVMESAGQDTVDNSAGSAGDLDVRVRIDGLALFTASAADQSWVGDIVYASDNQTVVLSGTTNSLVVGRVVRLVSSTQVEVWLTPGFAMPTPIGASGSTYTQTYSTANRTVAAPTAVVLTDNGTGSATTTIAAGVGVSQIAFDLDLAAGPMAATSAADLVTAFVPGFKFKLLALDFVTSVAGVGSSATQTLNLEIGSTDVTAGTCVITEASTSAVGELTAGAAITGANTGSASDTISVEIAASGTAFTAGHGTLIVTIQNMDTADAFASVAAEYNKLVADDLDNRQSISAIIDDGQTIGAWA